MDFRDCPLGPWSAARWHTGCSTNRETWCKPWTTVIWLCESRQVPTLPETQFPPPKTEDDGISSGCCGTR